jgi:hypothetical protein
MLLEALTVRQQARRDKMLEYTRRQGKAYTLQASVLALLVQKYKYCRSCGALVTRSRRIYLLYWYKSTNTDAAVAHSYPEIGMHTLQATISAKMQRVKQVLSLLAFTGTKVQLLTQRQARQIEKLDAEAEEEEDEFAHLEEDEELEMKINGGGALGAVAPLLHLCCSSVAALLHVCCTSLHLFAPLLHLCCTSVAAAACSVEVEMKIGLEMQINGGGALGARYLR